MTRRVVAQDLTNRVSSAATLEHTDVAALSAGVIAVAVTTIVTPGQYGGLGTVMSVTLLILIISYSWDGVRSLAHSIAFSAVIALIGMQVAAFLIELVNTHSPLDLLHGSDYGSEKAIAWSEALLKTCLANQPIPVGSCPQTYFDTEYKFARLALREKSRVDSAYLLLSWLAIGVFTLIVDRGVIFAGRWWPNSLAAKAARAVAQLDK